MENLTENPEYHQLLTQLKEQLFDELKQQSYPRMMGKGDLFDKYEYADPSGLNFYERYLNGEKLNSGWVNKTDFEK